MEVIQQRSLGIHLEILSANHSLILDSWADVGTLPFSLQNNKCPFSEDDSQWEENFFVIQVRTHVCVCIQPMYVRTHEKINFKNK